MNPALAHRYLWAIPASLLVAQPAWQSRGFSTRLTRHVSLRESWGQVVPSGWSIAEHGTLYLNRDELLFIGPTSNASVEFTDVIATEIYDGGREVGHFVVVHRRRGKSIAFGSGDAVCRGVTDMVSNGPFRERAEALIEGPAFRRALEARVPTLQGKPLDQMSDEELVKIEDFWSVENDTVANELAAAMLQISLGRTDHDDRRREIEAHLDALRPITIAIDEEVQRRGRGYRRARDETSSASDASVKALIANDTRALLLADTRRAGLADRLPNYARRSLDSLSHDDLLDLEMFWQQERLAELTDVEIRERSVDFGVDVPPPSVLAPPYLASVTRQLKRVEAEAERRWLSDESFREAQHAKLACRLDVYYRPQGVPLAEPPIAARK